MIWNIREVAKYYTLAMYIGPLPAGYFPLDHILWSRSEIETLQHVYQDWEEVVREFRREVGVVKPLVLKGPVWGSWIQFRSYGGEEPEICWCNVVNGETLVGKANNYLYPFWRDGLSINGPETNFPRYDHLGFKIPDKYVWASKKPTLIQFTRTPHLGVI